MHLPGKTQAERLVSNALLGRSKNRLSEDKASQRLRTCIASRNRWREVCWPKCQHETSGRGSKPCCISEKALLKALKRDTSVRWLVSSPKKTSWLILTHSHHSIFFCLKSIQQGQGSSQPPPATFEETFALISSAADDLNSCFI